MTTINRHGKYCAKMNRHNVSNECDCGVDAGDPHWYRRQLSILEADLFQT